MKRFADLSIRAKLVGIITLTTILAQILGFSLVIWKSINAFRDELINNTALVARVVGDYSVIDLAFEEREQADEDLRKLLAVPSITDAYLYDTAGQLFASYSQAGELHQPATVRQTTHYEIREGFLHYFTPVAFEGRTYGTLYLRVTTEGYRQQVSEYLLYMAGLMLVVVAVAVGLAYFLQGFISKPILNLAEVAQRISADNDYSVRVKKPGRDEIGSLYDGFNSMLQQISLRTEELERSNRDLDQFAYVASHDLKAPLRAIVTLSNWIEEDLKGKLSEEGQEQMRLLRSRVQRMDGLIEGILQYSRLGRLDSRGERVHVGELLRELIELIDPPQGFEFAIDPAMPIMVTKRLRLEQVFSNLITNAIKYHDRDDGKVEITVKPKGDFFEFSVTDDGPGIAPEHHKKVFMMFQTLQPRDKVESTGLGLSLVKKLVEDEGGSITLEAEIGQGSTFRFTWPARLDEAREEATS